MAVVIDFCRRPKTDLDKSLRHGNTEEMFPEWELPEETKRNDLAVLYAAGPVQAYLGTERIMSNWKTFRAGPWKGEEYVDTEDQRLFGRPVPAAEVEAAVGISRPRDAEVLPEGTGRDLLRFLRSRRRNAPEWAVEGILTESRRTNRSRNRGLRDAKLQANGTRCEACQKDYGLLPGNLDGRRVLMVHHRRQISAFDQPQEVALADLAVLCANCHMLVHADQSKAMPVEDLRRALRPRRPGR